MTDRLVLWEQVMRDSIERMNERYADGEPPESARPETLEKCWALIEELDRDNHVATLEWRRWRDRARALEARLPAFERLFNAVAASPGPLTGEIATAFYALREQEHGA